MRKKLSLLFLPILLLNLSVVFGVLPQPSIKTPTILEVSPSSATINIGESITLVATLKDSTGVPISGKTVSWSITQGSLSSSSCITNEEGKCEVSFTAPENEVLSGVVITAEFLGDDSYLRSEGIATIIVKEIENLPPIVILPELYPKYFTIGEGEKYRVSAIAIDDIGIKKVSLLYRVNGQKWNEIKMQEAEAIPMEKLSDIFSSEFVSKLSLLTPMYYTGEIPSQGAGSFVEFKVRVEDNDGNTIESHVEMYFVVKKGATKIMVVDPSVELWFYKRNAKHFAKLAEQFVNYNLPTFKIQYYQELANTLERYSKYVVQRHYWERIAKSYNIIITTSSQLSINKGEVEEALEGFKPRVIILSNVWLAPWDLSNDGMEKLVKYLRENNAGLIVTHGSIFDEVYWKDCKRENAEEIGARGQVGDNPEVYIDKDKETIALTIGLYPMPLFEFLRDQAAETVCSEDEKAGRALGSTPLAVPYVPFSGNLIVEEEHPIFKGIKLDEKNQFHVNIPSAYNEVGIDAYTLVGWQYVLPTDIPKVVKERAEIARDKAENYLEEISKFIQEFTGKKVESSYLLDGVEGEISKKLSKLNIENNIASFEINGKEYRFSLDNEVVKELASKIPAKAIALSDDLLAGIAVNDEWYREDGHRTVYFSFEPEASNSEITEKLLKNSIEWVSKFEYRPLNLMGVRKFTFSMIAKASSGVVSSSNVDLAIALSVFKELPTSKELGIQILLGSAGKPEGVEFTKDTLTYKGKTFKSSWGKEDYAIIQRTGDKVNIVGTHRFGTKAGLLYYQKYKPMGTIIIHWKDENNDEKVEIEEVEKVM